MDDIIRTSTDKFSKLHFVKHNAFEMSKDESLPFVFSGLQFEKYGDKAGLYKIHQYDHLKTLKPIPCDGGFAHF